MALGLGVGCVLGTNNCHATILGIALAYHLEFRANKDDLMVDFTQWPTFPIFRIKVNRRHIRFMFITIRQNDNGVNL